MHRHDDIAGQHFVVNFPGPEITRGLERLVHDGRVGGVILFGTNIRSVPQLRELTADLQRLAASAGLPPLLISVDQEGGIVNRITDGVTVFPSAMAVGASGRDEDAADMGRMTARELRAVGINTNHAPVLDVNINPHNPSIGIRAFGDDPKQVARLSRAYLQAAQAEGVLTTVKHFPGHGATPVDSHLDLPVVDKNPEMLRREDLVPFVEAFHAGADAVMVAHIVYPAFDARHPATLAPAILQTLLRDELGFEGLAFSDAMDMKAVADRWPRGEAAVMALAAGIDVVMACGTEEEQWASLDAVRQAVAEGSLKPKRLADGAARIQRVKARYTGAGPANDASGWAPHLHRAQEIADHAVTLLCDRGHIPLPDGPTAILHLAPPRWFPRVTQFGAQMQRRRPDVAIVGSIAELAGEAWENVVVASFSWSVDVSSGKIRALLERYGDHVVVVGLGNPYEIAQFPAARTYLAAYGPDAPSIAAAAKVLSGEIVPVGRLPVEIPALYSRGHRLDR